MFHSRFLELDTSANPVADSSSIRVEDRTPGCSIYVAYRAVDHVAGTWYEADIAVSDVPPSRREADLIGLNVDRGLLVPDGSEIVDGRELLRFQSAIDGQPDPVPTVTWVDPGTGRPVKVDGHDTDDTAYVGTYEYLPRSPENLALLDTPVPEGYVNTGTLDDDDDDFAGPDPLCSEESATG